MHTSVFKRPQVWMEQNRVQARPARVPAASLSLFSFVSKQRGLLRLDALGARSEEQRREPQPSLRCRTACETLAPPARGPVPYSQEGHRALHAADASFSLGPTYGPPN